MGVLTRIGLPKIWGEDPERLWPGLRHFVSTATMWLAPAYSYGAERVPRRGGAVLAANHLSAIDPSLVGAMSPRTVFYMAKAELIAMPIVGEALSFTGAFPVRRGEGDRESLRYARELVRGGHVVGVFMEGTRQRFGYPGEVHAGAAMLALREDVPVIPCGVYSFGWSRKNRTPCAVAFGDPVRLEGLPRAGRGYKEGAQVLAAEILRLWRTAGEAIAAGFPPVLPDGSRRGDPFGVPEARFVRRLATALR